MSYLMQQLQSTIGEKTDRYREYPDAKLLCRERKVKDRKDKEIRRDGSKYKIDTKIRIKEMDVSKWINKIHCGDSENILEEMPDNSIDIIITSPPYNFGLDYKEDEDQDAIHWSHYFSKLNRIWGECFRILKPAGRICVNVQPMFSDYIPTHHIISNQLSDLGLLWKGAILGVGTTTLVAEKLNRRHIGIDISENYCNIAEERIKEYKKQSRLQDFMGG